MQFGPIVIPCRACQAKPGVPCEGPSIRRRGVDFHIARVTDARRASKIVSDELGDEAI